MTNYKFMKAMGILLIVTLILLFIKLIFDASNGELMQASKYALLQKISLDNGKLYDAIDKPIILFRSKEQPYSVLGMPSKSKTHSLVWIILDDFDSGKDTTKIMPDNQDFIISCAYVESLRLKLRVTPEVLAFLGKKCD